MILLPAIRAALIPTAANSGVTGTTYMPVVSRSLPGIFSVTAAITRYSPRAVPGLPPAKDGAPATSYIRLSFSAIWIVMLQEEKSMLITVSLGCPRIIRAWDGADTIYPHMLWNTVTLQRTM